MNASTPSTIALPELGTPIEGGFFSGCILVAGQRYGLISAPRALEVKPTALYTGRKPFTGALSFCDGLANTREWADAGSALAKAILELEHEGFSDWYLGARDEVELQYRTFKPTATPNWCYRGDNPSSIPVGYAYQPPVPAQTAVEAFRAGGPEVFATAWYWSSTRFAGDASAAWCQDFADGDQSYDDVGNKLRARPVRRFPI